MTIPSYETVPDAWKRPFGPYVQAPDSAGGRWYLVNPFTGDEPWKREFPTDVLPEGFEAIFGQRPTSEGRLPPVFQKELNLWEQDLKYFKRAGPPDWASAEELSLSNATVEAWGMGVPLYYEGRYGFMAAFIDSKLPEYESAAHQVIFSTQHVVAQYQIQLRSKGMDPGDIHPFVPTGVV